MKILGGSHWTRSDVLALLTLLVGVVALCFTVKEFRVFLGLEPPEPAVIIDHKISQPSPSPTKRPDLNTEKKPTPRAEIPTPTSVVRQELSHASAPIPSSTSVVASPPVSKPQGKSGIFVTDDYTLLAETLRKTGDDIHLTIAAETHSAKPMRFYVSNCYLLDEVGERWELFEPDSSHFVQDAAELVPGTRLRSNFHFTAKANNSGTGFTFICTEYAPQAQRKIVLTGILQH